MKLIYWTYSILVSFLILLNYFIKKFNTLNYINIVWTYYSYFLSFIFILGFYILQQLHNYIYFYLMILITFLISITFINIVGNLGTNIAYKFIIWFLLTISTLTYTSSIQTLYHLYYNNYNDPQVGEKGVKGAPGIKGNNADTSINNNKLCINQLDKLTNSLLLKKLNSNDSTHNYFNNLFLKQKYKKMCDTIQ
jgi:hypothetical protein